MKSEAIALFKSLELCNAFRILGKISVESSQADFVRASVLGAIKDGRVKWGEYNYAFSSEEHLFIKEANRLFQIAQKTGDFSVATELNDKLILANVGEIKGFLSKIFSFDTVPILGYVEEVISAG